MASSPEMRFDSHAPRKYRTLIAVSVLTGIRQGEALGLQWADVDVKAGVLRVRRQLDRTGELVEPKTAAAKREVPIPPSLGRMLTAHREIALSRGQAKPTDFVFASETGTPLGHRNVTGRGFEPAAEHAGIEGISFHSMRHAFASRMIDRGISSTVLARLMGHESSAITERRYVHLFDKQRTDDAVRQAMSM